MGSTTSAATTLILSLCFFATASVCSAREWRGIMPLHSTCEDVKRVLGVSECTSQYETDEGQVYFTYSDAPCADGWNVPRGTVLHIAVVPKVAQRPEELGLDLHRFNKEISEDSPNYSYYSDEEEGIALSVTSDHKVYRIDFSPSARDKYLRYPGSLVRQPASASDGDPGTTHKFDEYGELSAVDERKRLDDYVLWLREQIEVQTFVIVYAGRHSYLGEAQSRADEIKKYLVSNKKVSEKRIVTIDGGYREQLTIELFARSKGGATPTATPTVCPSEVEIIGNGRVTSSRLEFREQRNPSVSMCVRHRR